jgi:methylmalonyl-CoA/ethylmalonyl-CoA epimerase
MKSVRVNHIGIAVEQLDTALAFYQTLNITAAGREVVPSQKVETAFLPIGDTRIELLQSIDPEGPIGKFLANKGEGLHHIAIEVDNIEAALSELKANGVRLIDEAPRSGAHGTRVAFVHPKAAHGVLIELVEPSSH